MAAASAALLALAGCGDPANEAPVAMLPGNYDVTLAGSLFGMKTEAESQGSRCVSTGAEHVPSALVRPYMALGEDCAAAKFERAGNKLTATAVCPLDPEMAAGSATMNFEGTIAADSIEGNLSIKLDVKDLPSAEAKLGAGLLSAAKLPFTAKRTGDCSGSSGVAAKNTRRESPSYDSVSETDPTDYETE